jgi:hypothetical protein
MNFGVTNFIVEEKMKKTKIIRKRKTLMFESYNLMNFME